LDGNTLELIFSCANRNLCDGKIEKDEKEGKPGKINVLIAIRSYAGSVI